MMKKKEKTDMGIMIEKMGTAGNMEQKVNSSVHKQHKNFLEGAAEWKEDRY